MNKIMIMMLISTFMLTGCVTNQEVSVSKLEDLGYKCTTVEDGELGSCTLTYVDFDDKFTKHTGTTKLDYRVSSNGVIIRGFYTKFHEQYSGINKDFVNIRIDGNMNNGKYYETCYKETSKLKEYKTDCSELYEGTIFYSKENLMYKQFIEKYKGLNNMYKVDLFYNK